MTMRYDALFLDSDETIVDFDECQRRAFCSLCAHLTPGEDPAQLYQLYRDVNERLWRRHHAGQLPKDELRTLRMRETFGGSVIDVPACAARYEELLASEVHFMPDAMAVLTRLHEKCTLVIVTNGLGPVHRARFARAGLTSLFAGIVVSGDQATPNYRKPFPEIFRDAHERFAPTVPKQRILMVGDSEATDVAGGAGYGIATCRYASQHRLERRDSAATHVIASWQELPPIVGLED